MNFISLNFFKLLTWINHSRSMNWKTVLRVYKNILMNEVLNLSVLLFGKAACYYILMVHSLTHKDNHH